MTSPKSGGSKSRRPHTKSREGCLICKKRKVKCDEARPRCRRCEAANRPCLYRQPPRTDASSASAISPAARSWSRGGSEEGTSLISVHARTAFSTNHMNIFHHAHLHMAEFMGIRGDIKPLLDIAMGTSHTEPYVLDQLLAVSALHLATKEPHLALLYKHEATELQTRALSSFNGLKADISDSNFLAAFLFATLLGVHMLRQSLDTADHSTGDFVTSFVSYIRLHRGVRTVTSQHWDKLLESPLQPLLYMSEVSLAADRGPSGDETKPLRDVLESLSVHTSPHVESCLLALKHVQWMIDLVKLDPSRLDIAIQAAFAWPLVIPDKFVSALYQRQPTALVVLAYYAATIHRLRDFWVFTDAGATLFDLISNHVGPFWSEGLSWPASKFSEP